MSKLIKNYNLLKQAEKGNFKELETYMKDVEKKLEVDSGAVQDVNLFEIVDVLGSNEGWLKSFSEGFSFANNGKRDANFFRKLTGEEKERSEAALQNYDVTLTATGGSNNPVSGVSVQTTIIPTIEGLVSDTGILSKIQLQEVGTVGYKKLYDFDDDSLETGSVLGEVAAGTDVDTKLRVGDTLIPDKKLQRSTTISNLALASFDPVEYGIFMARITRSVAKLAAQQILYGGNSVANGTAKGSTWRGIKNNYGVNGTGDAAGWIGAISYASKSATDTAITAAGGAASVDAYDLCYKVKKLLLPKYLVPEEEDKYYYVMNRNTWGKVSTVIDLNGRYKALSAIDPATGRSIKMIDGNEVLISPFVADNEVFLAPLSYYVAITKGGIININDGGITKIREGETVYVSRLYSDGSLRYGFKNTSTTAVTIGTTTPNNQDQNMWRTFFIV